MHIVDGALSNEVLIAGSAMSAVGLVMGLRKLEMDLIPAAGVLSAAFFVASLIHVPLGFSSVHLILNGLAGIILGWAAFPALFVGLLLQAVFFAFGGHFRSWGEYLQYRRASGAGRLVGQPVSYQGKISRYRCHLWWSRRCFGHRFDNPVRCLGSWFVRREFCLSGQAGIRRPHTDHDH